MVDPLAWLYWVVVVVAVFAAGMNLAYCLSPQRRVKKPLRAMSAIAVLYFALIYGLLGRGVFLVTDISGRLIRPGIIVLLLLLAADVVADWKRD